MLITGVGLHWQALVPDDSHSHGDDDNHGSHDHNTAVYKGLVALMGIYSFFLIERLMKIYSTYKRRRNIRRVGVSLCEGQGHHKRCCCVFTA